MKQKMKRMTVGVLAAVLVLSMGTLSVFAARPGRGKNFVDADQNGVCDYAVSSCQYIDSDHDGICDNRDKRKDTQIGQGKDFVDTNNDGVCDNFGTKSGRGFRGRHKR